MKLKTQVLPVLPEGITVPTAQVEDGNIVKLVTLVSEDVGRAVMVIGPLLKVGHCGGSVGYSWCPPIARKRGIGKWSWW